MENVINFLEQNLSYILLILFGIVMFLLGIANVYIRYKIKMNKLKAKANTWRDMALKVSAENKALLAKNFGQVEALREAKKKRLELELKVMKLTAELLITDHKISGYIFSDIKNMACNQTQPRNKKGQFTAKQSK